MQKNNSELINALFKPGMYMVLDKSFDGLEKLSRVLGRYIISNHPPGTFEFILPSSKTFWIHETNHFLFLGLWSGRLYMSNNANAFQNTIEHLFLTSSQMPCTLQDEFVSDKDLWEIQIFTLTDNSMQQEVKTSQAQFLKEKSFSNYSSWYIVEIPPLTVYFRFPEAYSEEFPLDIAVQNHEAENNLENSRKIICEYFQEQFLLSGVLVQDL